MKISIGLPTALPGTEGHLFAEWAIRAEKAGFASLGTIGRTVYDSYDELIVLAACASVTRRIGLATTVLIAPPRETVLLAKQASSLHCLSGGRLCLGLGVGWREDDFSVVGADWSRRGSTLDAQLAKLKEIWSGDQIGPLQQPRVPELMLGGAAPAALERAGRWADAYMAGPFETPVIAGYAQAVAAAAQRWGRPRPRFVTSRYFGLGDPQWVDRNVQAYFDIGGPAAVAGARAGVLESPEAIRQVLDEHRQIGADECCLWVQIPQLEQIDRLAEIVF
jgi:alkanesulfonate monooxygenase SsuD/methylene tetrahydromethanopterin reductase-like flavin-dependent oxidoreductase (luciferase family)